MKPQISIGVLVAAAVLTSGCDQPQSPQSDKNKITALEAKVKKLEDAVTVLQLQIETTEGRVSLAESSIRDLEPAKLVEFDPSVSSYQKLDGSLGAFAVSVEDVRQFADGVRVTLNLGNLTSATYSGATLILEYGPRAPSEEEMKDPAAAREWLGALQRKEENLTASLLPGRWNPVKVTLPKIDEKTFGYLSVRIRTNQISLR
jgi:Protein of unknown function (DUF3251)